MIRCGSCGRENDDSFKFCLDCGGVLAPQTGQQPSAPAVTGAKAAAEASRSTGTNAKAAVAAPRPPTNVAPVAPSPPPPPSAANPGPAATAPGACPKCAAPLAAGSAFCASCGQRLSQDTARGQTMFMHVASPEVANKPKARMILIKSDGSEGTVFTVAVEKTSLGRTQGFIMFPKDLFISPKHAELVFKDGKLSVVDLDSQNGVYRKMTDETQISPGTYFRIGRQLLRLEMPGDFQPLAVTPPEGDDSQFWGSPVPQVWARLVQVLEGGKIGEIHLLTQAEVMIGREDGEIRFPEDGFISSRHCLLTNKNGACFLRDLGSSNGTYLRIQKTQELANDDRIQIGNQVLRVDLT